MACAPTAPLPLEDAVSMVNDGSEGGLRMWTPDGHGKVNSDVTRESAQLRCQLLQCLGPALTQGLGRAGEQSLRTPAKQTDQLHATNPTSTVADRFADPSADMTYFGSKNLW